MKTIKTSELTGLALDWAVAKCEGFDCTEDMGLLIVEEYEDEYFSPSTKWSQGGWLIERERITLRVDIRGGKWVAFLDADRVTARHKGDTPLIASMRCYVASKLGDIVEIPKELLNGNN